MAKIKECILTFPPSPSPDVVGYKLYKEDAGTEVTHESSGYGLIGTTVDLSSVLPGDTDGIYNLGIVAVDDVGNESDFSLMNNVPLDFVPPEPPGTGVISYG